jgi:hypothetical protein
LHVDDEDNAVPLLQGDLDWRGRGAIEVTVDFSPFQELATIAANLEKFTGQEGIA